MAMKIDFCHTLFTFILMATKAKHQHKGLKLVHYAYTEPHFCRRLELLCMTQCIPKFPSDSKLATTNNFPNAPECRLASLYQVQIPTLFIVTLYASLITAGVAVGIAVGVGSAVVLLLAIIIVLTVTAVVKSCNKKGKCHSGSFWDHFKLYDTYSTQQTILIQKNRTTLQCILDNQMQLK